MSIYYDSISAALGINPLVDFDPNDIWDQAEPLSWGEGESNPFYGKKHDDEAKAKMSAAAKGRKYSEEYKQKMSETLKKHHAENPRGQEWRDKLSKSLTGYKKSEEHLKKLRETWSDGRRAGENNGMYGRKHSKETLEKMSKALKGKMAGENNPMYGKSAVKGKKWYNNGQVSGRFPEGEQPEGYIKGRLRKGE